MNYGITEENLIITNPDNGINIDIKYADDPDRIISLISTTGKFEFWETYEFKEIFPKLVRADEILKDSFFVTNNTENLKQHKVNIKDIDSLENKSLIDKAKNINEGNSNTKKKEYLMKQNPLFAYLALSLTNDETGNSVPLRGPVIGGCKIEDTAMVNNMLSRPYVKSLFPIFLKFAWALKPETEGSPFLNLIALRFSNNNKEPGLSGDFISDARQEFSQNGQVEISMTMNNEGAKIWKNLTYLASIDKKAIAIVMDNYVYTHPFVQAIIPNGRSQITGNLSATEAQDLATLIKFHRLPVPVIVVECKITDEQK